MQLFKYYFRMKSKQMLIFDFIYLAVLIIFFLIQLYLFLGSDTRVSFTFLEVLRGGLQSNRNIQNILIPFLPIVFIFPLIPVLFPQFFYVRNLKKFVDMQLYFYYFLYIMAFLIATITFKLTVQNRLVYDNNWNSVLSLAIYFLSVFVFFKLINLILLFTNNKIITLLSTYLFCYVDLFLEKVGIRLFFAHGLTATEILGDKSFLLKNSLFLIFYIVIVEVAQLWIISKKDYIKKIK